MPATLRVPARRARLEVRPVELPAEPARRAQLADFEQRRFHRLEQIVARLRKPRDHAGDPGPGNGCLDGRLGRDHRRTALGKVRGSLRIRPGSVRRRRAEIRAFPPSASSFCRMPPPRRLQRAHPGGRQVAIPAVRQDCDHGPSKPPARATRTAAATAVPADPPTSSPSSRSRRPTIAKLSASGICSAASITARSMTAGGAPAPIPSTRYALRRRPRRRAESRARGRTRPPGSSGRVRTPCGSGARCSRCTFRHRRAPSRG
ncbi:MAG: hypothetical protein QOD37_2552 [Gaiellales bacterium]|nr:hypothetical protein [Gaiellales bacterium]